MGPHPVPQNVTSFQFHLVGDMTLKQFLYLAIGVVIAYLLFVFFSSKMPILVWPLIVISAGSGAAFAFVPIGSRPLDHWVGAFFKAIYSPTQMYWKKAGKTYKEEPLFNNRYIAYTSTLRPLQIRPLQTLPIQNPTNPPVQDFKKITPGGVTNNPTMQVLSNQPIPAQLPTSDDLKKTVELAKEAQSLQVQIIATERTLNQIRSATSKPTPIPIDYSQEVTKVLSDLNKLITKATDIRSQMDSLNSLKNTPEKPEKVKTEQVRIVMAEKPKQTQIALTTFPNVISGIIKDISDNYIEGVVAVIYDKEGLPVRALKTNKLGQFSGSTPLPNGTYKLELEKDGFSFDVLQIQLDGRVMPPLQISAK